MLSRRALRIGQCEEGVVADTNEMAAAYVRGKFGVNLNRGPHKGHHVSADLELGVGAVNARSRALDHARSAPRAEALTASSTAPESRFVMAWVRS